MSKTSFFDKLKAAFKDRDETKFDSILKDHRVHDEEEETEEEREKRKKKEAEEKTEDSLKRILGDALSPLVARLDKLEKPVIKEEPVVTKTDVSAALVAEVQDTFARAEIVAPGVSLPTVDAKADAQKTRDSLCALRRKALEISFHGKGRDAIAPFLGEKPDFSAITCDAAKSALLGASEILKRENKGEVRFRDSKDARTEFQKQMDVTRDINARNAKFWNRPVN